MSKRCRHEDSQTAMKSVSLTGQTWTLFAVVAVNMQGQRDWSEEHAMNARRECMPIEYEGW